jgi:hypothetical protein
VRKDDDARNGDSSFSLLCNAVSTADVTGVKATEKKKEEIKKKNQQKIGGEMMGGMTILNLGYLVTLYQMLKLSLHSLDNESVVK